jgi:hypothetical protein
VIHIFDTAPPTTPATEDLEDYAVDEEEEQELSTGVVVLDSEDEEGNRTNKPKIVQKLDVVA